MSTPHNTTRDRQGHHPPSREGEAPYTTPHHMIKENEGNPHPHPARVCVGGTAHHTPHRHYKGDPSMGLSAASGSTASRGPGAANSAPFGSKEVRVFQGLRLTI